MKQIIAQNGFRLRAHHFLGQSPKKGMLLLAKHRLSQATLLLSPPSSFPSSASYSPSWADQLILLFVADNISSPWRSVSQKSINTNDILSQLQTLKKIMNRRDLCFFCNLNLIYDGLEITCLNIKSHLRCMYWPQWLFLAVSCLIWDKIINVRALLWISSLCCAYFSREVRGPIEHF